MNVSQDDELQLLDPRQDALVLEPPPSRSGRREGGG